MAEPTEPLLEALAVGRVARLPPRSHTHFAQNARNYVRLVSIVGLPIPEIDL